MTALRATLPRIEAWARDGIARVRPVLGPTLQTAVAAGLSWELCVRVLDHPRPIFAPITAIVAMGFTAGRRGRAALLLVLGVAIGIGVGDVLVRMLDRGGIQIAVVVFVAMILTLFLTREPVVVIQAGISAALLVGVDRQSTGLAPDRFEDALVGAAVAGVIAVLLFPIDPLEVVGRRARPIFATLDRSLSEAASALRDDRLDRAELARSLRADERTLADAVSVAREATRIAPRRRRQRDRVDEIARAVSQLETIVRGARTIAGASRRIVREGARRGPTSPKRSTRWPPRSIHSTDGWRPVTRSFATGHAATRRPRRCGPAQSRRRGSGPRRSRTSCRRSRWRSVARPALTRRTTVRWVTAW